eukprot:CAMPEP_0171658082 /NCGR_PEP_ID=MMETSP0990-20121206/42702_1 /TAXON_ID=483369 /ORGANISM="non described non described, Strain CCMP2098" /LENGTH=74 /DNA_ID=CAMNT_0012239153 /DNA_START=135 /DNA_END=355 /DNA_ORIENTATION=+
MSAPTSLASGLRYFSPWAMVHWNFSHEVSTSPIIASTTVFPLSRTDTRAMFSWFSNTNFSKVRSAWRRVSNELA